jgi:hypothetical protein
MWSSPMSSNNSPIMDRLDALSQSVQCPVCPTPPLGGWTGLDIGRGWGFERSGKIGYRAARVWRWPIGAAFGVVLPADPFGTLYGGPAWYTDGRWPGVELSAGWPRWSSGDYRLLCYGLIPSPAATYAASISFSARPFAPPILG